MNYGISILFRAIPLTMAVFCFGYGAFIYGYGDAGNRLVAGPVVFSLGMICIALFCTAATIIRQIIHTYNEATKYVLPVVGYLAAIITIVGGICIFNAATTTSAFVAGHVITGVGFITACVATAATSSTRFSLIPANAKATGNEVPEGAFSIRQTGNDHSRNRHFLYRMDMGVHPVKQQSLSSCLFCSRSCDGRARMYLYQSDCIGSNHSPSGPERLFGKRT